MVGKKNSTARRRRRIFREHDGRPDMGRLRRRWDELTETLLRDAHRGKLKDIADLPARFFPVVEEIEACCYYYWRPMHDAWTRPVRDAWDRNDPVRAARELRRAVQQAVRVGVTENALFAAMARARDARQVAWKRKSKGHNVRTRLEKWEREQGIRLTPQSPDDHIVLCAQKIGCAEVTLSNELYRRARERKPPQGG
jgi:hypothetical protein